MLGSDLRALSWEDLETSRACTRSVRGVSNRLCPLLQHLPQIGNLTIRVTRDDLVFPLQQEPSCPVVRDLDLIVPNSLLERAAMIVSRLRFSDKLRSVSLSIPLAGSSWVQKDNAMRSLMGHLAKDTLETLVIACSSQTMSVTVIPLLCELLKKPGSLKSLKSLSLKYVNDNGGDTTPFVTSLGVRFLSAAIRIPDLVIGVKIDLQLLANIDFVPHDGIKITGYGGPGMINLLLGEKQERGGQRVNVGTAQSFLWASSAFLHMKSTSSWIRHSKSSSLL